MVVSLHINRTIAALRIDTAAQANLISVTEINEGSPKLSRVPLKDDKRY